MTRTYRLALGAATMLAALLAAPLAAHAGVIVGAGSAVHFVDAKVDLGCGNLYVNGSADTTSATLADIASFSLSGAFMLGAGALALGSDFSNVGMFAPGTGTVMVSDACGSGTSTFSGASNFYSLSIATTTGKQAIFPIGLTQNVAHALTLQGTAENLLRIVSSTAGQQGVLALTAGTEQTIAYVDARDNRASATPIAPGAASLYKSVNSGDLTHWFDISVGGNASTPAPALDRLALLLLTALIAAFAWKRPRTS